MIHGLPVSIRFDTTDSPVMRSSLSSVRSATMESISCCKARASNFACRPGMRQNGRWNTNGARSI